jgi:type II secretory pathway component GspD/PulD (secretin)
MVNRRTNSLLDTPVSGEADRFNPAAVVPAGPPQGERSGARLTIGVDSRTNSLVVSASESLFRQVAAVAAAIDDSARDAHRNVHFVSRRDANSSVVRQGLTAVPGFRAALRLSPEK